MMFQKTKNNFILLTGILMIGCLSGCDDKEEYDGHIRLQDEHSLYPHGETFYTGDTIKVDLVHELYDGKLDFIDVHLYRRHKDLPGKITSSYDLQTYYSNKLIDTFHYQFIVPPIEVGPLETPSVYFNVKASGHSRRTGFNLDLNGLDKNLSRPEE